MSEKRIRIRPSRCKTLVIGNTTYRSFYDFEVTSLDLDKAYQELNEKLEERENCIRKLKEKLRKDLKFQCQTDDDYLLCFLRFRKFDTDKALNTILRNYSLRKHHSELFVLPHNLKQLLNLGFHNCLPYRNKEGMMIYWINFGKWNVEEVSIEDFLSSCFAMMELATMNPSCQIHGIVGLWDFKEFKLTARHLTTFMNPRFLWNLVSMLQECFPERIKLMVFVNCNAIVRKILNIAKALMMKKIADRFNIFDGESELHQYFEPALLPKTLGGELEDEECNITDHVMENLNFLKYLRSLENNTSDNSPA